MDKLFNTMDAMETTSSRSYAIDVPAQLTWIYWLGMLPASAIWDDVTTSSYIRRQP